MPRPVFTSFAVGSLAVALVILVLWERSYRGCDVLIGQRGPADRTTCTSEFGQVVFEREDPQAGTIQPGWSYFEKPLPRRFREPAPLAGFDAWHGGARHYLLLPPTLLWGVAVPYWFLFMMSATLPVIWALRWSTRRAQSRRRDAGLCARCGYDLRGSPSRCPECGFDPAYVNAVR